MVLCSSGAAMPAMATTASSVICRPASKRLRGLSGEQAERGKADGVQGAALAIDEAAEQIEGDHPQRALHGRGEAGEERVGERRGDGDERGGHARQAHAAREPEMQRSDDGQMEAGDDEHVEGAGALEADAERAGEIGAVAGDHGGEHDGVVGGEAQRRRQAAHGCGQCEQARGDGVLQMR